MSRISGAIVCVLVLTFGSSPFTCLKAEGQEVDASVKTIETIVTIWKARQQRTATVKFVCVGRQSFSKEALGSPGRRAAKQPPLEGVAFDSTKTIMLDGDKMRYQITGQIWDVREGRLVPQDWIATYDGKESRDFWPTASTKFRKGYINSQNRCSAVDDVNTKPVLITYRPLHQAMGFFKPERYVIAGQQGVINDRRCVILEEPPNTISDNVHTLWVDPARDYSILRYVVSSRGEASLKLDITYQKDPKHGWVPSGWDLTRLGSKQSVLESFSGTVKEYAINTPIDAGMFINEFPARTRVVDFRVKSDLGDHSEYIIKEDGSQRSILRSDFGATFQQLADTEPGMGLKKTPSSSGRWLILLTVTLLAVLGIRIFWVRRRRRTAKEQPTIARLPPPA